MQYIRRSGRLSESGVHFILRCVFELRGVQVLVCAVRTVISRLSRGWATAVTTTARDFVEVDATLSLMRKK